MSPAAPPLAIEEYRALRATIRERGTARVVIAVGIFVAWATLALAVSALAATPGTTLVPLFVLVAGFEAIFGLHVGVERIGRYLQVYYEDDPLTLPAWERVSLRLTRPAAGAGTLDPLFSGLFIVSTVLNLVPAALIGLAGSPSLLGIPVELTVYGVLHVVFVLRVVQAKRFSSTFRQAELELFRRLRADS